MTPQSIFRDEPLGSSCSLHRRGELRQPDGMSAERLGSLLNRLGRKSTGTVRVCAHPSRLAVNFFRHTTARERHEQAVIRSTRDRSHLMAVHT